MKHGEPHNRFEKLSRPKRVLLLCLTTIMFLFLLEVAAWGAFYIVWRITDRAYIAEEYVDSFELFGAKTIFESQSEFRTFYISGFKPNLAITARTPYGTDKYGLPINKESQAGRDLTVDGPAYRIFVLGGSTVMGSGSSTTLGAFLEDALNRQSEKLYEVITAGFDGSHSGQALARLSLELLYFAPDMIITYDGVNDLFWSSFLDPYRPNDHLSGRLIKRILEKDATIHRPFLALNWPALDSFFRRFYIYQGIVSVLWKIGVSIPTVYDVSDQEYFDEILNFKEAKFRKLGADTYLENLRSISAISNIRGIRTMHFLQPTLATELFERGPNARAQEWELLEIKGLKGHLNRKLRAKIYHDFYRYVRNEFTRRAAAPENELQTWIDLSTFFKNVDDLTEVYYDAAHYHDFRTQEIAEEIAVHVQRALAQPKKE
jgi:hypothetical protein